MVVQHICRAHRNTFTHFKIELLEVIDFNTSNLIRGNENRTRTHCPVLSWQVTITNKSFVIFLKFRSQHDSNHTQGTYTVHTVIPAAWLGLVSLLNSLSLSSLSFSYSKVIVLVSHVYCPSKLLSLCLVVHFFNWHFPFLTPRNSNSGIQIIQL